MLCITYCSQISIKLMIISFNENGNFFMLMVSLMCYWQTPLMVAIVTDTLPRESYVVYQIIISTHVFSNYADITLIVFFELLLSLVPQFSRRYIFATDFWCWNCESKWCWNVSFALKKNESTNYQCDGYLYYTCSQLSSLSITERLYK